MQHLRQIGIAVGLLGLAWVLGNAAFAEAPAATILSSAAASAKHAVIPIWPGVAPGSEGWAQKEADTFSDRDARHLTGVRNVVTPTLTVYLPNRNKANGTAMIVCPGGGFRYLAWDYEGSDAAEWLAARGVTAFVLKYRLVRMPEDEKEFEDALARWDAMIQARFKSGPALSLESIHSDDNESLQDLALAVADGRQAIKVVRQRAAEWKIDPDRIGIMGFSAGAFLTMGVVMDHDAESKPNFAAPIYGGQVGKHAVPSDAPPLFIAVAQDDHLAPLVDKLYADWHSAGGSAELHIYAKGGHGFGMTKQNLPVDHWIDQFGEWLDWQHLLTPRNANGATTTKH